MSTGKLQIDLAAVVANWRALDALTDCETGAVVKANAYGLGAVEVSRALARAGARKFFVAAADEGATVRQAVGSGPLVLILSGHMAGDTAMILEHDLTPLINSVDQMLRHVERTPHHSFGIQLDTGMNRLGLEPTEWTALRDIAIRQMPVMVMSHLSCSDVPDHPMNVRQLRIFKELTSGIDVPRSLSATGGILLGKDWHFDLTRPGIGLYGGLPFAQAQRVVTLDLPVVQVREVEPGETVGYGYAWIAERRTRIATVAAGYADGLFRAMGPNAWLYHGDTACPVAGRVSMDLIGVDVTGLAHEPDMLSILGPHQSVDDLAQAADTIGYEILASLGARYARTFSR